MRAFVTGCSGFVGRNLIAMLRLHGYDVRALARSEPAATIVRDAGAVPIYGDIQNGATMRDGMRDCDVVFHAAALIHHWNYEAEQWYINVDGTNRVLDAATDAGVPRLVFISAAAVISTGTPIVDADECRPIPPEPFGPYAQSKARAEQLVLEANSPELTTSAVRLPAVWGAGDTTLLAELITAVRRRRFVWIDGGHYLYATCHVRNVCEGALLAAQSGRGEEAYFLTDGPEITFHRFVSDLLATQGLRAGILSVPRPVAWRTAIIAEMLWRRLRLPGEPPVSRGLLAVLGGEITISDAKARRELGYTAHVSRAEGLAELRM